MINLTMTGNFDFQTESGKLMTEAFQTCLQYFQAGENGTALDLDITFTHRTNGIVIEVGFGGENPAWFFYSTPPEEVGRIASKDGVINPRSFVETILAAREAACAGA